SMLSSPTLSVYPAVCRICHSSEASIPYNGAAPGEPLISPCSCNYRGTMGLYHRSCLERWLTTSKTNCCEICKFAFQIR
uniref:RING-CH-type domain-containing protein n=1 Tax=Parascaris univalens TaxID=6257 RepID=A0A914ZL30_PARUN